MKAYNIQFNLKLTHLLLVIILVCLWSGLTDIGTTMVYFYLAFYSIFSALFALTMFILSLPGRADSLTSNNMIVGLADNMQPDSKANMIVNSVFHIAVIISLFFASYSTLANTYTVIWALYSFLNIAFMNRLKGMVVKKQ